MHQGHTWMVWLSLCRLHPISFPDRKTVCVSYWVSGNKTSSTPNPNLPSASIYSQHHVLRFPCHMLVKRISTGEMMMLTDFVTTGQFPQWWRKPFISFSDFSVGCCINREKDYLLPTWARKTTCCISTECFRRNVGKFFSELKLVTDNLSLYLKPFMWGQRLTGAYELAKCHNTNQQSIQDLTFMQKVLSCVTTLWP